MMTRLELLRRRLGLDGTTPSGPARSEPRPTPERREGGMPLSGRGICIHE